MTYYMYKNRQHNSFDGPRAKSRPHLVVDTREIAIRGLSGILDENLQHGTKIDFMSVDVEGFELNVLGSIVRPEHWPSLMTLEAVAPFDQVAQLPHIAFACSKGYELIAYCGHDAVLMKSQP